jgi:hypothetical protein
VNEFRVDEKGKIYTSHVNKRTARVVVATRTNVVHGTMHLLLDNRLKDELNNDERFMALTVAEVFDNTGKSRLYEASAILLNKEQIVWVLPQDNGDSRSED